MRKRRSKSGYTIPSIVESVNMLIFMHGIWPSKRMRRRLEYLPIYVGHQRVYGGLYGLGAGEVEKPYPVLHKQARKRYPEETRRVLSTIKKHPGIVGQMERLQMKDIAPSLYFLGTPDPSGTTFGSTEIRGYAHAPTREVFIHSPPEHTDMSKSDYIAKFVEKVTSEYPESDWKKHYDLIEKHTDRIIFKDDSKRERDRKIRLSFAGTTFHELKHVEQSEDPVMFETQASKESDLPWVERKTEIEAEEFSRKKLKERLEKGEITPRMYKKILRL